MSDFEENFIIERAETEEQFGKTPRWLFELKPSSNAIRIYGYLDCVHGNSKRGIFPGQDTLAEANGLSKKSVQRAMNELQDLGALKVRRRGQGKTNLYTLVWFNPAKPALVQKPARKPASTRKQPTQIRSNPRACASPTKPAREVAAVSQEQLERQRAKRAEDERKRAQAEADRKARQAERDQWAFEEVLEGISL